MRSLLQAFVNKLLNSYSATQLLENTILAVQPLPLAVPPGFSPDERLRVRDFGSADGPIFISSRFRSGSTLLWRFFRESSHFTAFYEPLNPRRWFDPSIRGDRVDSSHRGVSDYWREYESLSNTNVPWSDQWASRDLYLPPFAPNLKMREYFSLLIEAASERPVLQFNRCDFRLHWLATYFPTATIIHLHREPRDQWLSTFLTREPVSPTATMADFLPHDEFYLVQWVRDLRRWFPLLREVDDWHPYEVSYLIWRLSEIYASNCADLSISYEELIHQPEQTLGEIESVAKCDGLVKSELIDGLDSRSVQRWRKYAAEEWFEQAESRVNRLLEEILGRVTAEVGI